GSYRDTSKQRAEADDLSVRPGRWRHVSSHLSRQCAHVSGLGRQFTELLAPIGGLQLHHLSNVLCPSQAYRETETGINITPSNLDSLTVERDGALTSIDESLPTLQYGFERALIKLARLDHTLLGQSAH